MADDLRALLQIRINQADIFSPGVLQTGVDAGFLAEIPGEGDHLGGAFLCSMELFQVVQRGIRTAVVDKNQFVVVTAPVKGGDYRILKCSHIFRLIIAGDDQGKFHEIISHFIGYALLYLYYFPPSIGFFS